MFKVLPYFLLLAVLVSRSQEHPCALDSQELLNKLLSIKQQCGSIGYSDCCQIKRVTDLMPTGPTHITFQSGIYDILDPCARGGFTTTRRYNQARCDMDTDNGGWLVIQRRVENGTVDFYRDWSDYEEGFGDLEGEFWYGLKNIHCLTNSASMELRMDMEDESGNKITWTYQEFRVEGPENKYRLHIGGGEGTPETPTDPMAETANKYFTTRDRDNDGSGGLNCAQYFTGAWWYVGCGNSNPNGVHDPTSRVTSRITSIITGNWVYYPNFEMKIRPKSCASLTSDTCA